MNRLAGFVILAFLMASCASGGETFKKEINSQSRFPGENDQSEMTGDSAQNDKNDKGSLPFAVVKNAFRLSFENTRETKISTTACSNYPQLIYVKYTSSLPISDLVTIDNSRTLLFCVEDQSGKTITDHVQIQLDEDKLLESPISLVISDIVKLSRYEDQQFELGKSKTLSIYFSYQGKKCTNELVIDLDKNPPCPPLPKTFVLNTGIKSSDFNAMEDLAGYIHSQVCNKSLFSLTRKESYEDDKIHIFDLEKSSQTTIPINKMKAINNGLGRILTGCTKDSSTFYLYSQGASADSESSFVSCWISNPLKMIWRANIDTTCDEIRYDTGNNKLVGRDSQSNIVWILDDSGKRESLSNQEYTVEGDKNGLHSINLVANKEKKIIWSKQYPANFNNRAQGYECSPTICLDATIDFINSDVVVSSGSMGICEPHPFWVKKIEALDLKTGKSIWESNLNNMTGRLPYWLKNSLIFDGSGLLFSFDRKTGKLNWSTNLNNKSNITRDELMASNLNNSYTTSFIDGDDFLNLSIVIDEPR